jgi:hypothetical protein
MMNSWTLITHGGQANLALEGETLGDAVGSALSQVMKAIGMEAAAGYRLETVKLIPLPSDSRTRVEITARSYHLDTLQEVRTYTGIITGPGLDAPIDV